MRLKNRLVLCFSGLGTISNNHCKMWMFNTGLIYSFINSRERPKDIQISHVFEVYLVKDLTFALVIFHLIEMWNKSRNRCLISENFIPSLIPTMWCFLSWIAALLFIRSYHRVNKTARNSLLSSLVTRSNDQTDTQNTTERLRACPSQILRILHASFFNRRQRKRSD